MRGSKFRPLAIVLLVFIFIVGLSLFLYPYFRGAMIDHEILENGLRKVTYSGGTVIYVNYTGTDLTADGVTVPAMGWAVQ